MAGIKINDLPQTTHLEDNDLLVAEQQDGTKKITFSFIRNIKDLINYYTKKDIDDKYKALDSKLDDKYKMMDNKIDTKYKALDNKMNTKATNDGIMQSNLNSDMLDGRHANYFQKNIVVSGAPPTNPSFGDLWIDTSDN